VTVPVLTELSDFKSSIPQPSRICSLSSGKCHVSNSHAPTAAAQVARATARSEARTESPDGLQDQYGAHEAFLMVDLTLPANDNERWAHPNRLGSTVVVTNASGTAVNTYAYAPFGTSGDGDGEYIFL